ncbi:ribonuclease III [Candidatus Nomurabacteria bacterium RIFCSPHIGHO2_01_FULL_39_220]|uniref:Ribonuclease 3 n=1 Tax=Candidatus Nomurabacteria bacterium RIFCSPLOWO2_02_FULL_40_67 TaxID=1801787 RepID=A0A1F6Y2I2_9BACT|nr:MAG: Ribonuclease 3 [Parcubacteria group bacterium GW2011_GWA2_40_37]KKS72316.1 MAG: Ribonuclease 3 [Parcubacteria group bacterium GW2011_GWF2_42_7]OGI62396.1 MAG: ribonuclease III [Candidatus Nomurabacteria bacterium RBG_16_40_11]OGI70919.1 MAG: ribonuclease III [Candidatus Nomurabacteria bacterium RIFCSPHIGHO2_01_FULL_39_220]OGI72368.1 MAG: ribonuclease III [Candidatus Nomurabacteria bacterium RIFCSPHIGHO2_02_41_18]OGI78930.1 MAG: ribonuclease III [Candidatus Nomurabacteria bacterium RIFC
MINFSDFEKKTKVIFKNKKLLEQAFIHRSYINENPGTKLSHNERLEFLGDAVLELIVTDFLYKKYPNYTEGELTALRSALVNAVIISEIASGIGMNDYLLLSKGEHKDNGKARQYILANTYEAYIGAIYLDQGIETVDKFVCKTLLPNTEEIVRKKLWRDAKSLVQEKAQDFVNFTPAYKVLRESGPDHDKNFTVGIYFGPNLIAEGKGQSKQEAEQSAALAALKVKNWLD